MDYLTLPTRRAPTLEAVRTDVEAGRSRRGLLLGLTPLVSEPSWPPEPDQAWLRIAVPTDRSFRFRFPAIHPDRVRGLPPGATLER